MSEEEMTIQAKCQRCNAVWDTSDQLPNECFACGFPWGKRLRGGIALSFRQLELFLGLPMDSIRHVHAKNEYESINVAHDDKDSGAILLNDWDQIPYTYFAHTKYFGYEEDE